MRWLGIHQSDLDRLGIFKVKLTKKDMKKIEDLQNRSYIDVDFSKHLMAMKLGKAEIESVNKPIKHFLTKLFIPEKIRKKEYF
jgi:DNA topoisomerase VI subunit A